MAMKKSDLIQLARVRRQYLGCPELNGSSIVHMLYFPSDKDNQTMKADGSDFDHALYDMMSHALRGKYCIKLWNASDLRSYVTAEYPGLWELVEKKAVRPQVLVDFYRLIVVHDFGGIFWQYGSEPTRLMWKSSDPLELFMPPEGKSARFLLKRRIPQEKADEMDRTRETRTGKPTPLARITTEAFSALPHNEFLRFIVKRAIVDLLTIRLKSDNDILETMGSGMVSEAFADFEKLPRKADAIDLVEPEQTRKMVADSDLSGTHVHNATKHRNHSRHAENTTLIDRFMRAPHDVEMAMLKSELYRHKHARQKYLKCRDEKVLNTPGIHIVHMLYFPWNQTTQTMKANESEFDHTFYERLSAKLVGKYCVKLWHVSDMRSYVKAEYPGLWELLVAKADRPVALVDFFRMLVVHDFGGIFWQYGSELTPRMWKLSNPFEPFMPPENKSARLLVEKWLTQEQADDIALRRKSRKRIPPALKRIATQVFAALPHDAFLRFACRKALNNLLTIPVKRDYDILETMGNGMFSEAFNDFEKLGKATGVEVVDFQDMQSMVKFSHTFSWRRDKGRCC